MDTIHMNRQPNSPTPQPDKGTSHPHSSSNRIEQTRLSVTHSPLNGIHQTVRRMSHSEKQRVTISLPTPLIERLRNAVYWTGHRPLVALVSEAIEDIVAQMEEVNGGAYPQRVAPLKVGRRQGQRSPLRPATGHSSTSAFPDRP